jgi:hypothetical protein
MGHSWKRSDYDGERLGEEAASMALIWPRFLDEAAAANSMNL